MTNETISELFKLNLRTKGVSAIRTNLIVYHASRQTNFNQIKHELILIYPKLNERVVACSNLSIIHPKNHDRRKT